MRLQADNKLILTGTPIQNHLSELWNLFAFITPGMLGSYEQFSRKYITPIEQEGNKEKQRQLKRIVSPFMLRRTKTEVLEELPDKMEIILPVELSEKEMSIYEALRLEAKKEIETTSGVNVSTLDSNHPFAPGRLCHVSDQPGIEERPAPKYRCSSASSTKLKKGTTVY